MQNARLDELQAGIKTAERTISNFRYADDTALMTERVKEESEKSGLKFNIQKMKIMASDPVTSWQTEGEKMETVTDFIFLGSKITVDCSFSSEIKRCLLFGGKGMTSLDKSLPTNIHTVIMYGCESWTIKKAECQKLMLLNCGIGEDS